MMTVFGVIGLVLIIIAIVIEDNRRQAGFELVGGVALLVYSISIGNVIFIALQSAYILAAWYEIVKTKSNIKNQTSK